MFERLKIFLSAKFLMRWNCIMFVVIVVYCVFVFVMFGVVWVCVCVHVNKLCVMSLCLSKVAYIKLEGKNISTTNPFLNWIIYGGMSETGKQNDDDNNDRLTVSKWHKHTHKQKQQTTIHLQKWQQQLFRTFFTNRIIKNATEQKISGGKNENWERKRVKERQKEMKE